MNRVDIDKASWDPKALLVAALLMAGGWFGSAIILGLFKFVPELILSDYIGFISLMAPIIYLQTKYPLNRSDFGLDRIKKTFIGGIIGGIIVSFGNITFFFSVATQYGYKVDPQEYVGWDAGRPNVAIFLLFGIIIVPIVEEILFRGNIYRIIKNRYDAFWATGATCLIWTIMHGSISALYSGFIFVVIYERSKSLGSCILAHMMTNAIYYITIYTYAST